MCVYRSHIIDKFHTQPIGLELKTTLFTLILQEEIIFELEHVPVHTHNSNITPHYSFCKVGVVLLLLQVEVEKNWKLDQVEVGNI